MRPLNPTKPEWRCCSALQSGGLDISTLPERGTFLLCCDTSISALYSVSRSLLHSSHPVKHPAVLLALFIHTLPLSAQCGRCGPDGNPPGRPVGEVPTVFLRSVRPDPLPDSAGTLSLQLRSHYVSLSRATPLFGTTTEILLDANLSRPLTLIGLELRPPSGSPVSLGIGAANAISIPAGSSSVAVQGPQFAVSALETGAYTLYVRTADRPDGYFLGSVVEAKETIALANLPSATVAVRANAGRQTDGTLSSADLEFQIRASGSTAPTTLLLRLGGPAGPIAFELPVAASLSGRVVIDPANSFTALALAAFLLDPADVYAELRAGSTSLGGDRLGRPDTLSYGVASPNLAPDGAFLSAGTVTIHALRSPDGGILAALANFAWFYRGFTPGTVLRHISFAGSGTPQLALAGRNGLTVNASGIGMVNQSYPLLASDALLRYLIVPAAVSGTISATTGAGPVIRVAYSEDINPLPAPGLAITSIVPPVSTPGSIISIYGRSFPANPLVTVGGVPGRLLFAAATQINLLVPPDLPIGHKSVFVLGPDAVSNRAELLLDVSEPFVFSDASGPTVFHAATGLPVRAANPATAGSDLIVYATGLAVRSGLTYSVNIGPATVIRLAAVPAAGLPGVWTLAFALPSGVPAGSQPLVVTANFDGSNKKFPSAPVNLAVR